MNRGRILVKPQPFNVLKYDTVGKKIHSVEKPVALMRHLVEASSVKGEIVLDPFAGSGIPWLQRLNWDAGSSGSRSIRTSIAARWTVLLVTWRVRRYLTYRQLLILSLLAMISPTSLLDVIAYRKGLHRWTV